MCQLTQMRELYKVKDRDLWKPYPIQQYYLVSRENRATLVKFYTLINAPAIGFPFGSTPRPTQGDMSGNMRGWSWFLFFPWVRGSSRGGFRVHELGGVICSNVESWMQQPMGISQKNPTMGGILSTFLHSHCNPPGKPWQPCYDTS